MTSQPRPIVAVVGRPNVGKSTLVNRLVGRREAIVEEKPGVTRDRTSHVADWRGQRIEVVDTGGWTPGWSDQRSHLDAAVSSQAEIATASADLVLVVVDASVGVTEEDAAVAEWVRRAGLEVVLVANKADNLGTAAEADLGIAELYSLGLGEPQPVSALHGRGSGDLLDEVWDRLVANDAFRPRERPDDDLPAVALLGRPNVGKSSLLNRLSGEDRAIVDDRPGTTRDAVDTVVTGEGGTQYRFVDTAGLRRPAKVRSGRDATEFYSTVRTTKALEAADVALLVLDAGETVSEQDQRLAATIIEAGRAVVLVWNKWDLVDAETKALREREADRLLNFLAFAPQVRVSALTKRGLHRILPAVDAVLVEWRRRIPTAQLNAWLADAVAATAPPMAPGGRSVRLRFVTQVDVGPPTFRVFGTGKVPPAYTRYLERRLRETYGFEGTPIDIAVRVRTKWEDRETG